MATYLQINISCSQEKVKLLTRLDGDSDTANKLYHRIQRCSHSTFKRLKIGGIEVDSVLYDDLPDIVKIQGTELVFECEEDKELIVLDEKENEATCAPLPLVRQRVSEPPAKKQNVFTNKDIMYNLVIDELAKTKVTFTSQSSATYIASVSIPRTYCNPATNKGPYLPIL